MRKCKGLQQQRNKTSRFLLQLQKNKRELRKGTFHLFLTRDLECLWGLKTQLNTRTNTSQDSSQDTQFQLKFVASLLTAKEETDFCLQGRSYNTVYSSQGTNFYQYYYFLPLLFTSKTVQAVPSCSASQPLKTKILLGICLLNACQMRL